MLIKATGIKGYVPQGLKTAINRTKISSNFGPKRVKDVLGGKSNPNIDQNTLNKIFEKIDETGTLKISWAESKEKFTREVAKQQRIEDRQQKIDKQIEQKNQETAQKTVKPKDEKASKIAAMRLETERAKRGREIRFGNKAIGKLEQVIEAQSKFRKTWGKSAELGVKSTGVVPIIEEKSTGLLNKVKQEEAGNEKNSQKGSKGGQKSGGNVSTNQKNSGRQGVSIMGTTGIDQLTHPQEVSSSESFTGGVYHVKGLDKESANKPETPPVQKSDPVPVSAPKDITDLDIG